MVSSDLRKMRKTIQSDIGNLMDNTRQTTVQDYMKIEAINLWVYNGLYKKWREFTFRVSSSKRRNL